MSKRVFKRRNFLSLVGCGLVGTYTYKFYNFKEPTYFYSIFKISAKSSYPIKPSAFAKNKRLTDMLPKNSSNNSWIRRHDELRESFIAQTKLLESSKYLQGDTMVFVNKWSNRKDYEDFCQGCQTEFAISQLEENFIIECTTTDNSPELIAHSSQLILKNKYS